jgi:hypothetical protein
VEIWTFIGTHGFFLMLFLLFIRFLPLIAMSEVKSVLPESDPHFDPERRKLDNIVPAPAYPGDLEHTGGRPETAGAPAPATI